MRKEFIVERQGRAFCLYAGLLDLAHQQGLKSIRTELVQVPSEANNRVAICAATVVLEQDGVAREFTGLGDAAPNNVAPAMQTCLLRMAETRAKARALRDAVNIGVAAFEELGEEDAHDGAPERGYQAGPARSQRAERPVAPPARADGNGAPAARPAAVQSRPERVAEPAAAAAAPARAAAKPAPEGGATDTQIEAIRSLSRRKGVDPEVEAREKFGAESLVEITNDQAVEMIRALNARPGARTPVGV